MEEEAPGGRYSQRKLYWPVHSAQGDTTTMLMASVGHVECIGTSRLRCTENNSAQFQPAQLSIDQERSENATNDASLHESIEDSTGYNKLQGQRRTEYSVCNLWIAFSPTKNCVIKNTSIRHIFSSSIDALR